MGRHTRIRRRPSTGVYQFRIPIPLDLQGHGPYVTRTGKPKTEIALSLGTRDYREAVALEPIQSLKAEQEFARLRRLRDGAVASELSSTEIDRLAAIYLHQRLEEDDEVRLDGLGDEDLFLSVKRELEAAGVGFVSPYTEAQAKRTAGMSDREFEKVGDAVEFMAPVYAQALARGDTSVVGDEVDELLAAQGVKLDRASAAYRKLSYAILKASVQANEAARKRHAGELVDTPPAPPPFVREVASAPSGSAEAPDEAKLVDAILAGWKRDRRPSATAVDQFTGRLKLFREHIAPKPLAEATKVDAASWKASLQTAGLKPSTVATYMTSVKALIRWGVNNGHLQSNPFDTVSRPSLKQKRGERQRPYSEEEAVKLLLDARSRKGYRRWVPWLLAFSGARIAEVCQCLTTDVRQTAGVHYLDFNEDGPGKSLKTTGSERSVPIHPKLIAEGFLDYVEALPQGGSLFPDLVPDKYGSRGGTASDTLKHWVRGPMKITDPRISPNHSWRHRFKDLCRNAGIPQAVHDRLTGHDRIDRNEGDSYGEGFAVPVLADWMGRIGVPEGL